MKRLSILFLVIIICLLSACSGTKPTDPTDEHASSSRETDAAQTEAATEAPKKVNSSNAALFTSDRACYLESDDSLIVRSVFDSTVYQYQGSGKGKKLLDDSVIDMAALGDKLYYTLYQANVGEELYRMSSDGSDKELLITPENDMINYIMVREDKIYYTDDGLVIYDIKTKTSEKVALDGSHFFYHNDELYYFSDDNSLNYYDFDTKNSITVDNTLEDDTVLLPDRDAYYILTDLQFETKESDIYRITDDNKIEKLQTVKTDGVLSIPAILGDTVIYQSYSEKDHSFTTYTMSLKTGDTKTIDDINYKLNRGEAGTSPYFTAGNRFLVFDEEKGSFQQISNIKNESGSDKILYYDGKSCFYTEDATEHSVKQLTVEFSDKTPKADELFSVAPSSPDNEYVRLKRTLSNKEGFLFQIPEITIDSADAKKINKELDAEKLSSFGEYYRCEINDNYLTLYTVSSDLNSIRFYQLYTIDINTGTQLTNDDVIALITGDKDAFMSSLDTAMEEEQNYVYGRAITGLEEENENRKSNGTETEIPSDRAEEIKKMRQNNPELGYLGNGKVICTSSFAHAAGAGGSTHAFIFDYYNN